MSLKPESIDAAAAGGGTAVSVWNFILGGDIGDLSDINTILGAVLALLSIVVLTQRFLINRREIDRQQREQRE